MSFLKCCVGADARPPPEAIRPAHAASAGRRSAGRPPPAPPNKLKLPHEVFFDPSKPDGQLSSVTDPAAAAPEKRRASREPRPKDDDKDLQDNNGLTRGQNFMKVEKWLRNACMYQQIDVTPASIANLEDEPAPATADPEPPSEKDRIPPAMLSSNHSDTRAR